ncbi:MAG: hypothetical protein ACFBRM_09920 [Pikeienuella sp.]
MQGSLSSSVAVIALIVGVVVLFGELQSRYPALRELTQVFGLG